MGEWLVSTPSGDKQVAFLLLFAIQVLSLES